MKYIPLTRGLVALIDDEDYELVSQYKWSATRSKHTWYARAWMVWKGGKRSQVGMHCLIMNGMHDEASVDHRNRDGLDNRRSNLRPANHSQQGANSGLSPQNTSGFRGVSFYKRTGRWQASLRSEMRIQSLGYFDTAEDAARAYDARARVVYGDFAHLNFP